MRSSHFFFSSLPQKQPVLRRVHKYNYRELKATNECWSLETQERDYFTEELIFQLTGWWWLWASNKKGHRRNMHVAECTGRNDGVGSGVSGCSGSLPSQTLAGCSAVGANWQLYPALQGLTLPNTHADSTDWWNQCHWTLKRSLNPRVKAEQLLQVMQKWTVFFPQL